MSLIFPASFWSHYVCFLLDCWTYFTCLLSLEMLLIISWVNDSIFFVNWKFGRKTFKVWFMNSNLNLSKNLKHFDNKKRLSGSNRTGILPKIKIGIISKVGYYNSICVHFYMLLLNSLYHRSTKYRQYIKANLTLSEHRFKSMNFHLWQELYFSKGCILFPNLLTHFFFLIRSKTTHRDSIKRTTFFYFLHAS